MQRLLFGIDVFLGQIDQFKNLRLALVTNNAATSLDGSLSRVALLKQGANLIKLFSPEHGVTTRGEDGVFQDNAIDRITGLPVTSLYGERMKPSAGDLDDIDAVLFDIPDAGCRFFTYLWTMTYVMEACEEANKPLFILDRPNPIGGNLAITEGPMLDETHCSSFVGRWSIPLRHSCTLAELGCYFATTRVKNIRLQVFKMHEWKRQETLSTVSWPFVPDRKSTRLNSSH